ncbi:MAG: MBL fold metallo-hydrolase [Cephaloticoccus sp.]|nr:MBL fold metallo-hydrolase [Cephaloticoccus sp.]MCF7761427.1 MBL fold metallo-hydrolase [Cephaloticoccus sp.]
MKIQLLGTAGGDFPRVDDLADDFESLPRVRALGGRNLRRPAQAVIFPDFLIDFYDGDQLARFGIAPETIKHLFITHIHWDHFRPLQILKFAATLPHQLQVHGSHYVIEALKFANTYDFDRSAGRFLIREKPTNVGCHTLEPMLTYRIGETAITPVHGNHSIDKSEHMIMQDMCLNYVFERNRKTVFYGLDSSYTLPHTFEFLRQFRIDVAVLDATFGRRPIDPVTSGHHNFPMLKETISEFQAAGIFHEQTTLLASHMALAHAEPHDDLKDVAVEMGFTLAYDGMEIEA